MRALIQRVSQAEVRIEGKIKCSIKKGLLVFLGIHEIDGIEDVIKLVNKICQLRILPDEQGKMNKSIIDEGGDLMLISQFTLYGQTTKGNRPSFIEAAKPETAIPLYEACIKSFEDKLGKPIATGTFGSDMQVSSVNDGPVTIWYDTEINSEVR